MWFLIFLVVTIAVTLLAAGGYATKTIGDAATFENKVDDECEDAAIQYTQAFNEIPEVSSDAELIREVHSATEYKGGEVSVPVQRAVPTLDGHEGRSRKDDEGNGGEDSAIGSVKGSEVDKPDNIAGVTNNGDVASAHAVTH